MNSRILILSFVIAITFTITLTETLQTSDGLLSSATKLIYQVGIGETQMLIWTLVNNEADPVTLELYATGPGSELFTYEQYVDVQPGKTKDIEVFVIIPNNHKNNIEYHPELFALKRGVSDSKESGVAVNLQMKTSPIIKIGDNPIYTPPTIKQVEKSEEKQSIKINTPPPVETLQEKLARIQAANEVNESHVDIKNDDSFKPEPITPVSSESSDGGGCLIATAAYGSELAPQVQFLRELRDNTILSTESGTAFMGSFNQVYYSFSPIIADLERENPLFKESVKLLLTPMLSTLSIMTLAEDGSESQVLGLGISVIALNLAMYIAAPAMIVHRLRK